MLPIAPVINAVMIPPIMVLGAAAGVNPALYALPVIFTASCAFLLPLDAVPLVTYSRGYYRMFDMLPAGTRHQRRLGGADDGVADRDWPVGRTPVAAQPATGETYPASIRGDQGDARLRRRPPPQLPALYGLVLALSRNSGAEPWQT